MNYNNRFYKIANTPRMNIGISNSTNPDEFAANVFQTMISTRNPSVAVAIDQMARQNATYNNVIIREVPEIQELYRRVVNHSGEIDQNLLSSTVRDLIGNAIPGQEQKQYTDAKNARATELQKEDELYQVMLKALSPLIGALSLKLENGEIWAILRERPEFVQALDNEAKKSSNYAQLVEKFNNKFRTSMAPKQTLPQIRSSSSVQEFVQKLMQFAQEDRIERLDIALDQYWRKGGKLNGVDIMSIPAIKQIYQEAQVNPVRLDAASLTNRLNQLSGSGTQPQQPQSVSQMYGPQDLRNYQSTMEHQINSFNRNNIPSMSQSYIATFEMYEQYLRQNNINDPNYQRYKKLYDSIKNKQNAPQQPEKPQQDRSA
jgi:hypothetical protein